MIDVKCAVFTKKTIFHLACDLARQNTHKNPKEKCISIHVYPSNIVILL
jgi:hypothetical protein